MEQQLNSPEVKLLMSGKKTDEKPKRAELYQSKPGGDFKPGNPGRPAGSLNKKEKTFVEYFDEICDEIAIQNKLSVDAVKKIIYKVGYSKAKEGNYQFYKDILDRIHGQATQKIDQSTELKVSKLDEIQKGLRETLNEKDNDAGAKLI
jgi:hypothetical protein